jgi:hypothetical protein
MLSERATRDEGMAVMTESDLRPDGISPQHARTLGRRGHANPLGLILLGAVMLAAVLGFAGYEVDRSASANDVTLSWHAPERIRNGEFLEMRITIQATRPIERLVLGVDEELWRDFTINTLIPAAAEELSQGGEFRFDFGAMEAGQSLLVKIYGQINPDAKGINSGMLRAYDGEQLLVEMPLRFEVLP